MGVNFLLTGRLHPTSPHGRDGVREDGPDQRHHQAVQERDLRDHVRLMLDDDDEIDDVDASGMRSLRSCELINSTQALT